MALLYSDPVTIYSPAPDFDLPGVDGKNHSLSSYADSDILVVVFMCNHCPYVIAVRERLFQIQREYRDRGVTVVGINPNDAERYPDDSFEKMKEYARTLNFNFDYLRDETQEVARAYGAVCTPDIFVFDSDRTLQYRGRIDDNWRDPEKATEHDLRHALDDLLNGRQISWEMKPSMGCSIKWR